MADDPAGQVSVPTLVMTGGPLDGTAYPLKLAGRQAVIGSSTDADVQIVLGNVEALHAWVGFEAGFLVISDAGSATGTFVNGEKIEGAQPLRDGDRICLGPPGARGSAKLLVRVPGATPPPPRPPSQERPKHLHWRTMAPLRLSTATLPSSDRATLSRRRHRSSIWRARQTRSRAITPSQRRMTPKPRSHSSRRTTKTTACSLHRVPTSVPDAGRCSRTPCGTASVGRSAFRLAGPAAPATTARGGRTSFGGPRSAAAPRGDRLTAPPPQARRPDSTRPDYQDELPSIPVPPSAERSARAEAFPTHRPAPAPAGRRSRPVSRRRRRLPSIPVLPVAAGLLAVAAVCPLSSGSCSCAKSRPSSSLPAPTRPSPARP